MNELEVRTDWIETNNDLEHVKRLLERYPHDMKLKMREQELRKQRIELSDKLSVFE